MFKTLGKCLFFRVRPIADYHAVFGVRPLLEDKSPFFTGVSLPIKPNIWQAKTG